MLPIMFSYLILLCNESIAFCRSPTILGPHCFQERFPVSFLGVLEVPVLGPPYNGEWTFQNSLQRSIHCIIKNYVTLFSQWNWSLPFISHGLIILVMHTRATQWRLTSQVSINIFGILLGMVYVCVMLPLWISHCRTSSWLLPTIIVICWWHYPLMICIHVVVLQITFGKNLR